MRTLPDRQKAPRRPAERALARHRQGQRRRISRCHLTGGDESGQALVEFALVLPLVILLVGVAFNGWNGMQLDIGLTSAARAGAIQAANDLGADPTQTQTAWNDAVTAVNAEQGVANLYQNTNANGDNYVNLSTATDTIAGGITINVVTITISQVSQTLIPVVANFHISVGAEARYS